MSDSITQSTQWAKQYKKQYIDTTDDCLLNHTVSPELFTFILVDDQCPKQSSEDGDGGRCPD